MSFLLSYMMRYKPVNLTCYSLSAHSYNIFRLLISAQTNMSMMAPLSQYQVMRVLDLSSIFFSCDRKFHTSDRPFHLF